MSEIETVNTGLNGVKICESNVSSTTIDDKERPILMYRSYSIYDLVKTSFEEALFLLMNERIPKKEELSAFQAELKKYRTLDSKIVDHIKTYPKNVNRMDYLFTTLSYARMFDEDYENGLWQDPKADPAELIELYRRAGIRLGAKILTLIAYGEQILNGRDPVEPDPNLSHAANFFHMMGLDSDPKMIEGFEKTQILYLDHTLNCSTFASRVAESARPDPYSPPLAAAVSLKGVLHGGANEMVRAMFDEIKTPENVEKYVLDRLDRSEIIFGFGHRLAHYKTNVESRVTIATEIVKSLTAKKGLGHLAEIYDKLMALMISDKVPERKHRAPNVDFPVAVIYQVLGIPVEWNTPLFQASRHFGWISHMMEQRKDKCPIYRPTHVPVRGAFSDLKKFVSAKEG